MPKIRLRALVDELMQLKDCGDNHQGVALKLDDMSLVAMNYKGSLLLAAYQDDQWQSQLLSLNAKAIREAMIRYTGNKDVMSFGFEHCEIDVDEKSLNVNGFKSIEIETIEINEEDIYE